MQCQICQQVIEGKTQAKLINHVKEAHQLSLENYVILTEFGNQAPLCACGLCNERPLFRRGKFSKYALNHDSFEWKEQSYIEKHGQPKCLRCNNSVTFHRGVPHQFCTHTCSGLYKGGFTQQATQEKIKQIMFDTYGVNAASQIKEVRNKISLRQNGAGNSFFGLKHDPHTLVKISNASKDAWKNNDERRESFSSIMHNVRKRNWQNPTYRKTILEGNLSGKHSKLHQRIASQLGLKDLGFESEKVIFRYRIDEVNFAKKIIVEINGDYIHANPNKFKPDDLIIVRKSQYLAKDKWLYDQKRKEALESLGFIVFVVWESDDLNIKTNQLMEILNGS